MDFVSAFKSELFRPLVTLLVPGGIASGPWLLLALQWWPSVRTFMDTHAIAAWVIVTTIVTATGLTLENIGARIEGSLWDKLLQKRNPNHSREWRQYLQLSTNDEIVGQRYLRTLLVRLKFELAMAPALVIGSIGTWLIHVESGILGSNVWKFGLFVYAAAALFLWESFSSATIMASTRQDVLTGARLSTSTRRRR